MNNTAQNYHSVQSAIAHVCSTYQRGTHSVLLLAVSKKQAVEQLVLAYQAGARAFGENYVQEGVDKIEAFDALLPDNQAMWHFIGALQSNKTRSVAEYFDWVHTVDRLKIAQRLSEQRPTSRAPLNMCLQVNISDESSKNGCAPADALALAQQISLLPSIKLRGLMAIPAPIARDASVKQQRAPFLAMQQLFNDIKAQLPPPVATHFDTLSMGMSDDFEHAIAAGSTMVRIGTAIFGAR